MPERQRASVEVPRPTEELQQRIGQEKFDVELLARGSARIAGCPAQAAGVVAAVRGPEKVSWSISMIR
jgi:hypothetical protein